MAIARVQTSTAGATGAVAVTELDTAFGSNCASGSLIVVAIRADNNATTPTVTDDLGTTYSLVDSVTGHNPQVWMFSGVTSSAGANTVNVAFSGAGRTFRWVIAVEYSGQHATPGDTSDDKTGTGTADLTTDAITTAAAGLLVMAASQSNFATYSAGTDFTLITGTIGTGGSNFGGIQEYITSGALTTHTPHMTSTITNAYAAVVGAFVAAEGGGGGGLSIPIASYHYRHHLRH